MSAPKTIGAFFGWLMVAFIGVSAVRIYALGRFDATVGRQLQNLLLIGFFDIVIAAVITIGFAIPLLRRGAPPISFPGLRLPIASALACGLVYAFTLAGLFLSASFRSSQLNIALLGLYSVAVGAAIALGLIRLGRGRQYAA